MGAGILPRVMKCGRVHHAIISVSIKTIQSTNFDRCSVFAGAHEKMNDVHTGEVNRDHLTFPNRTILFNITKVVLVVHKFHN